MSENYSTDGIFTDHDLSLLEDVVTQECEDELYPFVVNAWPVIEPGHTFIPGHPRKTGGHIRLICDILECISAGKGHRKTIINIPPRYMKPVDEDSIILMDDGGRKLLKDVVVGDRVITCKGRGARVEEIAIQGSLPTIEIETHSGRVIRAAADHPFLTPEGWVNAGDLVPGMVLGLIVPDGRLPSTTPLEAFRLAGYFVGDGCTAPAGPRTGCQSEITCYDDEELIDINHCADVMGFGTNLYHKHKRVSVTNGSRDWLRDVGLARKTSWDKRVPEFVFAGDTTQIAHFVGAYFACDGTFQKMPCRRSTTKISFTSVNRDLLADVQHLLLRLGIRSRVRAHNQKHNNFVGGPYTSWVLDLATRDDVTKFIDTIPIYHSKRDRLHELRCGRADFQRSLIADEIVDIRPGGVKRCRCLRVDRDRSFTISDVVVSNSRLVSVMWPTWTWIRQPTKRFLTISYSGNLADDFITDRINIVKSDWFRARWGGRFRLTRDRSDDIINDHLGRWQSAGMDGTITGKGGDIVQIDDPVNPKKAWSDAEREAANRTFDQTIYPWRLDDKINGAVLIIMQRLHSIDVTGHVTQLESDDLNDWHITTDDGWELYRLPAIAEDDWNITSPLTGKLIMHLDEGDPLWPEFEPLENLLSVKRRNEYTFMGQLQQRPAGKGGNMFKYVWFNHYESAPTRFDFYVTSWDLTFKGTKTSNYVVGQAWGKLGAKYYLLDQVRGKWSFPETVKQFIAFSETSYGKRGPKLVEDAANGSALVDSLKEYVDGIKLIPVHDSKLNRAQSVTDLFDSGDVFAPPVTVPWVPGWKSELGNFPTGAYDDQVDATSQALSYLRTLGGKPLATAERLVKRNLFVRGV